MEGIVSWGTYLPKYRIKVEEIASVWGQDPGQIKRGLMINEKTVPAIDEDSATMAVEASRRAVRQAKIAPEKISAVYFGSESHPYAVKPTGTIVGDALGISPHYTTADLEFACKAGTAAIQVVAGLVKGGIISYGLAGGVDTAQARPSDPLEYTAAAGGACFILGNEKVAAEIVDTASFTSDTPDFWRREHSEFPRHGGAFTGDKAYFKHIIGATKRIMEKTGTKPGDFNHVVFHQPNGKFPRKVAELLGFTDKQTKAGLLVDWIGNTYSASSLMGLAQILNIAEPGQLILITSYGSGAGSDSIIFRITNRINDLKRELININTKKYLSYAQYANHRKKLK